MGDMADEFLNDVMDDEELTLDYMFGDINTSDAVDRGILDELGALPTSGRSMPKTCRCCGTTGLTWGRYRGKWRLFNKQGVHRCPTNPLKE